MLKELASYLTARMVSQWSNLNGPVDYENQPPVDRTDQDIWSRFVVRFGDQQLASIGDGKVTDLKFRVHLQIFVRHSLGTGRALELADAFATIFQYLRYQDGNFSIQGKAPGVPIVSGDDNWLQLNVSIPMIATHIV